MAMRLLRPPPARAPPARSQRHPDYLAAAGASSGAPAPRVVRDRPLLEADPRYRRTDYSAELARAARAEFAACLAAGEASLDLARASLLLAAEDDAIASSSTVAFPVDAFAARIARLASDTAAALEAAAAAAAAPASSSSISSRSSSSSEQWPALRAMPPGEVAAGVQAALFLQAHAAATAAASPSGKQPWWARVPCAGFSAPPYGRSNLPPGALVDHPGVWEDARLSYLHELLVRKRGSPAALAVLLSEVLRQCLLLGAIDWHATIDLGDLASLPRARPLPGLRARGAVPGAADSPRLLNTCSSEALAELLRGLKRAYWPFPWDTNVDSPADGGRGSLGGFRPAAKAALGGELSAAWQAVAATAAHRLSRGIFTSPGGGDLARCIGACERLVLLVGPEQPVERRDLAVLLMHAGRLPEAAAELRAVQAAVRARQLRLDAFDARLVAELAKLLQDAGVTPDCEPLSVERVLADSSSGSAGGAREDAQSPESWRSLTW